MWREQVPELAARFRVINIDLRGHGASGEVTRRCSIYDLVGDVCRVLDDVGEASAIWAGLSVGGMIAMRAALVTPERVDALLLLDTDAAAERPFNRIKYRVMGAVARALGFGPLRGQISRQMFGATTMRQRGPLVEEWSRRFAELHVPSILWMLGALTTRDDVTPRLQEIAVPGLVLVGAEDRSLPPGRSRRIAARLPNATLQEIAGAGHLSTLEQPREVTDVMLSFLDELDQRSGNLNYT